MSFQSQGGGGPGGNLRDIMLFLGGDDPVKLNNVAVQIAKEMATIPNSAPRGSAATFRSRKSRSGRAPILPPILA